MFSKCPIHGYRRNANGRPSLPPREFLDIYFSFVVQAIGGYPGPADGLLRRYAREIETVARFLQYAANNDPSGNVYRGLLLLPEQVPSNRMLTGSDYQGATFTSFTSNLGVACMFANTETFISRGVALSRPGVSGWIGEYRITSVDANRILFSYTWLPWIERVSLMDAIREIAIMVQERLAPQLADPLTLWNQISHSLAHQNEVVLKSDIVYPIKPISDYSCPSTMEIEHLYRYKPPYIHILDPRTFRPRRFQITNIEFNDPPQGCPHCGRNGIRMILVSDNLRYMSCDDCETGWPEISE
jgi:hypothetical protein